MYVSDFACASASVQSQVWMCRPRPTSTVSKTLMTPGCRSVRSFLRAFLASGRAARFAVMSKENMLQLEPSSYEIAVGVSQGISWVVGCETSTYPLGPVVECPDGGVHVNLVSECVRERRPFGHGRGNGRLEELHGCVDSGAILGFVRSVRGAAACRVLRGREVVRGAYL